MPTLTASATARAAVPLDEQPASGGPPPPVFASQIHLKTLSQRLDSLMQCLTFFLASLCYFGFAWPSLYTRYNDPMDERLFRETLAAAAPVSLTEAQLAQCAHFAALVVETNKTLNLTRITEPEAMAIKHFADALTLLQAVPDLPQGARVCDVGTGAGFPGVPLKLVRPDLKLTLVDSLRKRLMFLEGALATLGVPGVALIHSRAEELKGQRFELVTARAVAALPKLLTWCAPLVITGGRFVAMKGADVESDEGAAAKQGLVLERQLSLTLADPEQSQRTLLVYRKQGGG